MTKKTKKNIFPEEKKKDIARVGRTIIFAGPTSDGKTKLIQTIHPSESGGYGLNELLGVDVTRKKIKLKDKAGNIIPLKEFMPKSKKWARKFASSTKYNEITRAYENATVISKTCIKAKKEKEESEESTKPEGKVIEVLELGGDIFSKGETFKEEDVLTLFSIGDTNKNQEKTVKLAQKDDELIEMGKRKTREIFEELNYVMRFESNYGNRNLRGVIDIINEKQGGETGAVAIHRALKIKEFIEHGTVKLMPIREILNKRDNEEPEQILSLIKESAEKTIKLYRDHNIAEQCYPMSEDFLAIISNNEKDDKTKVNELTFLMQEFDSERFSEIKKEVLEKMKEFDDNKIVEVKQKLSDKKEQPETRVTVTCENLIKTIRKDIENNPSLTLATVFSVISTLSSYPHLESKSKKIRTLTPLIKTLDNLGTGLGDCNLEELVRGDYYSGTPLSSKILVTKIDTLIPFFIDYNAIDKDKLAEFGITAEETKTSTKFDFQFNENNKEKQIFKMPISPFKISYFKHFALNKTINLIMDAFNEKQITAGEASDFLSKAFENKEVKDLDAMLGAYYASDPTIETLRPNDLSAVKELSAIDRNIFKNFSDFATKVIGHSNMLISEASSFPMRITNKSPEEKMPDQEVSNISLQLMGLFKEYSKLATLKIPLFGEEIKEELKLESEFKSVNDFYGKNSVAFEKDIENSYIESPFSRSADYKVIGYEVKKAMKAMKEEFGEKKKVDASSIGDLYVNFYLSSIPKNVSDRLIGKNQAEDLINVISEFHSLAGHETFTKTLQAFVIQKIAEKLGKRSLIPQIQKRGDNIVSGDFELDGKISELWYKLATEVNPSFDGNSLLTQLNQCEERMRTELDIVNDPARYSQFYNYKSELLKYMVSLVFSAVRPEIPGYVDANFWNSLNVIPETNQMIAEFYDGITGVNNVVEEVKSKKQKVGEALARDMKNSLSRTIKTFGPEGIENAINEAKDGCLESLLANLSASYKTNIRKLEYVNNKFSEIEKTIKSSEYDQMDRIIYVEEKKADKQPAAPIKAKVWANPEYPAITLADLNEKSFEGLSAIAELAFTPIRAYLFPKYKHLMMVDNVLPCYSQVIVKKDPSKPEFDENDVRVNVDLVTNVWKDLLEINKEERKPKVRIS